MRFIECKKLYFSDNQNRFISKCTEGNYELRFHNDCAYDFYMDLQTIDYYAEKITNSALCNELFKCKTWEVIEDG